MATMTAPVRVKKRKIQKGMTLTPKLGPGLGFGLAVVAFYFLIPKTSPLPPLTAETQSTKK
jgi:hypothetical protein